MPKNIVVIGWGQIAELLCGHPDVLGHTSDGSLEHIVDGHTKEPLGRVDSSIHRGVIGIGKNEYKHARAQQWLEQGNELGTLVFPSAYVSEHAIIGDGSVVMPLAFVDNDSVVGTCSIIGPQSALRVARVGDYCHLTIQTKILPNSTVEDYVFIGSGAAILEGKTVGRSSVIGANSTVAHDIPPRYIYFEKTTNACLRPNTTAYPQTEAEKHNG